jgi:hypothetical protein
MAIEPSEAPVSNAEPPAEIPLFTRMIARSLGFLIRPLRRKQHSWADSHLDSIVNNVKRCQDRRALENLFGRPFLVVTGPMHEAGPCDALLAKWDRVEHYQRGLNAVTLAFRGPSLVTTVVQAPLFSPAFDAALFGFRQDYRRIVWDSYHKVQP